MVRDGAIAAATIEAVAVAYVGPAVVATVAVSPATLAWDALGETATLAAEARDRHGNVVAATFTWSSYDAAVATVEPVSGLVTATGNGTANVRATVGAVSGSASLAVAQRVDSVVATPASITLTSIGATHSMMATVHAPQSPSAQPSFAPVSPLARKNSSSVVLGETSATRTDRPFRMNSNALAISNRCEKHNEAQRGCNGTVATPAKSGSARFEGLVGLHR